MRPFLFLSLFLFSLHSEEPTLADCLPLGNQIVKSTKRIAFEYYPYAYNPSLIKYQDGFLMSFRYSPDYYGQPWVSYICVVQLNAALEPIDEPQILSTRQKGSLTPSQSEDARLFSYRGRYYVIYNDCTETLWQGYWDRRDMYMAELHDNGGEFTLSPPLKLIFDEVYSQQICQKNWVPFEWDKTLLLSYTLNPHKVLYPNLRSGSCYPCYETKREITWNYGTLRGSTPPLLVDGEYLAFFHSGCLLPSITNEEFDQWHYFAGAYTFSSEPPFELKRMSPFPIIADDFYPHSYSYKRVIFPGGCVVDGDTIYMAYGRDDYEIWIAVLDKKTLQDSLVEIKN